MTVVAKKVGLGILVLHNVDDQLIVKLSDRAARNQRSIEAEHRAILEQVLRGPSADESFKTVAAKLRAMTSGRRHTPSEELLRQGRRERRGQ
jgi:antitoxin FitA